MRQHTGLASLFYNEDIIRSSFWTSLKKETNSIAPLVLSLWDYTFPYKTLKIENSFPHHK